ncbi:hypothetical protein AVEN_268117-1, partial [Araneus ventricosus]
MVTTLKFPKKSTNWKMFELWRRNLIWPVQNTKDLHGIEGSETETPSALNPETIPTE